jgi:type VI secretion system protein ImpH
MAAKNRSLLVQKGVNAKEWCFFQFVRFFECIQYKNNKETPRIGYSSELKTEPVRFKQKATFSFQSSDLSHISKDKDLTEIYVNFLGLLGPDGPLPLALTEYIFNRSKHFEDKTLTNFLDMFHHRMISFYYRAWADSQLTVNADRPDSDNFRKYLSSLIGINDIHSSDKETEELSEIKIYNSAHYIKKEFSSDDLVSVLKSYIKLPLKVIQFAGAYFNIPKPQRFLLNNTDKDEKLGKNILIGNRYYSRKDKIQVVLGPLNYNEYKIFLPESKGFNQLKSIIKGLIPANLLFDIQLILKNSEVPKLNLAQGKTILGKSSFLGNSYSFYKNKNFTYNVKNI